MYTIIIYYITEQKSGLFFIVFCVRFLLTLIRDFIITQYNTIFILLFVIARYS